MVNKNIVENAIATIQQNIRELQNAVDIDWNIYTSDIRSRRFIERTLHVIIEACIDIAHHIISDQGFREPYTYRDAFVVLNENGILPDHELPAFEKIAMSETSLFIITSETSLFIITRKSMMKSCMEYSEITFPI